MAFNGSGTFERLYNWVADKAADIKITASRMDGEMDGFASGLSNCVTKDGQTNPTADLPMSSQKHTGVANADARDQYAAVGQVQDSAFIYAADASNTDDYVLSPTPAITAYAAGQTFIAKITNANTGATTLNVSAVGAKNVYDRDGNALVGGEIPAGGICTFVYDGTQFQLMSNEVTATVQTKGKVVLASNPQINGGTATDKAVTPAGLVHLTSGSSTQKVAKEALATDVATWVLIAEQSTSTGQWNTFNSADLADYNEFEIVFSDLRDTDVASSAVAALQVSQSSTWRTASYEGTYSQNDNGTLTAAANPGGYIALSGSLTVENVTDDLGLHGRIYIHAIGDRVFIQWQCGGYQAIDVRGSAVYPAQTALDGIRIGLDTATSVTLASRVRLYGRQGS